MKLVDISIEGFRSFLQPTVLRIPLGPGLFHIRGENKVDPGLGGNAVGKSTLMEAVCWCFYGKTSRGLSGPAIQAWGSKESSVQVTLEISGEQFSIKRTRSPNNLYLGVEIVSQEVIEDLLHLSYDRFLQCVLLGQFGTMFPDMKPTARLDLISQVLELDYWSEAATAAKESLAKLDAEITNRDKTLHGLEERKKATQENLEKSLGWAGDWDWQKKDRLKKRRKDLKEVEAPVKELLVKQQDQEKALREAQARVEAAKEEGASLEVRLKKELRNDAQRQAEYRTAKKAMDTARKALEELDTPEQSCPLCGQKVDTSTHDVLLSKAELAFEEARLELEAAEDRQSRARTAYEMMKKNLSKKDLETKAASTDQEQCRRELDSTLSALAKIKRDSQRISEEIESLDKQDNPHEVAVAGFQETLADLEVKIVENEAFLYDTVTSQSFLKDWPKLFKELRLWVVEMALDELEIHVNSSLMELGLPGWSVSFQVERETKAGKVSRGFDILIQSPSSPVGVPWEAWSGGETQRLRVACAAGIAELIRSRTLADPFFEIWDEPTAHLDEHGVKDLISYFGSRSQERQIWIVDHRSLDSGAFDASLTITKDQRGSHINMEGLQHVL